MKWKGFGLGQMRKAVTTLGGDWCHGSLVYPQYLKFKLHSPGRGGAPFIKSHVDPLHLKWLCISSWERPPDRASKFLWLQLHPNSLEILSRGHALFCPQYPDLSTQHTNTQPGHQNSKTIHKLNLLNSSYMIFPGAFKHVDVKMSYWPGRNKKQVLFRASEIWTPEFDVEMLWLFLAF